MVHKVYPENNKDFGRTVHPERGHFYCDLFYPRSSPFFTLLQINNNIPHLFQLKMECEVLIKDTKCRKCTRCKTILLPLLSFSYYRLSIVFTRFMCEIRSYLNRGILDRLYHRRNTLLPFEMYTLESGEPLSHTLNWKPLRFLSHIKCRTNDDRFPLSLREVRFFSTLGVPIPELLGPSQWCTCNVFHYDSFGDHLQVCKVKSVSS
jgi:hypothetical protein